MFENCPDVQFNQFFPKLVDKRFWFSMDPGDRFFCTFGGFSSGICGQSLCLHSSLYVLRPGLHGLVVALGYVPLDAPMRLAVAVIPCCWSYVFP